MLIGMISGQVLPTMGKVFSQTFIAISRTALSAKGKSVAKTAAKLGVGLVTTVASGCANKRIDDSLKKNKERGGLTKEEKDKLEYKAIMTKSGACFGIGAVGTAAEMLIKKSINSA